MDYIEFLSDNFIPLVTSDAVQAVLKAIEILREDVLFSAYSEKGFKNSMDAKKNVTENNQKEVETLGHRSPSSEYTALDSTIKETLTDITTRMTCAIRSEQFYKFHSLLQEAYSLKSLVMTNPSFLKFSASKTWQEAYSITIGDSPDHSTLAMKQLKQKHQRLFQITVRKLQEQRRKISEEKGKEIGKIRGMLTEERDRSRELREIVEVLKKEQAENEELNRINIENYEKITRALEEDQEEIKLLKQDLELCCNHYNKEELALFCEDLNERAKSWYFGGKTEINFKPEDNNLYIDFDHKSHYEFAKTLELRLPDLKKIEVSFSSSSKEAAIIEFLIKRYSNKVQTFKLSSTNTLSSVSPYMDALFRLQANVTQRMSLSNFEISSRNLVHLFKSFRSKDCLEFISCSLTFSCTPSFKPYPSSCNLQKLNLSDCAFTGNVCSYFSKLMKGLSKWTAFRDSLRTVRAGGLGIGREDVGAVLEENGFENVVVWEEDLR
ncbi:unnamed protein product [Moneuplotes crassus]|uniref:Uncharacterized protein n=1 Tax=Euplotes crassus TaxID=5936 RepID=A0AAD1X8H8_EUPCR|nr:unnamed protein product [Moneuplotes crassus]